MKICLTSLIIREMQIEKLIKLAKEGLIFPSGGEMCSERQKSYTLIVGRRTGGTIWKTHWPYLVNSGIIYPIDQQFHSYKYTYYPGKLLYSVQGYFIIKAKNWLNYLSREDSISYGKHYTIVKMNEQLHVTTQMNLKNIILN